MQAVAVPEHGIEQVAQRSWQSGPEITGAIEDLVAFVEATQGLDAQDRRQGVEESSRRG